jgi:hypothetical protein
MTFTVRDLMLQVLPVDEHAFRLCQSQTGPPPPQKPEPGPKQPPAPQPQCVPFTATGTPVVQAAGQELQDLAMLREQLQEALRSADGAAQR